MKAAFYAGDHTITLGACTPVDPAPGQVRIQVSHCGIRGTDLHIYHGAMDQRVKMPAILGHEMAGTIEAVGDGFVKMTEGGDCMKILIDCRE